ncbi:AAA family ATPase [Candidatus Falkowbacteria bacterium]|nr:AAA family ATPase [Candidatus Falkowbacteria bacterium]
MIKQVIFIGGVNSCGKTVITETLQRNKGYLIGKQKRALIEVGEKKGYNWEEIPQHYEELIEQAAELLADRFQESDQEIMLIDCHYAFKMKKALAMNLEKKDINEDEPFIQAIDNRLIKIFQRKFRIRFIFLEAKPELVLQRIKERQKNIGDQVATLESISDSQDAELKFWKEITKNFSIEEQDKTIIKNDEKIEKAITDVLSFIEK